jgi:hypothetical protein
MMLAITPGGSGTFFSFATASMAAAKGAKSFCGR